MKAILDNIKNPDYISSLSAEELYKLSKEIRSFLIKSISKTGGHIGANLGVIELTVAIHKIMERDDKIIFDTGHQGYTHKLLTGRKELFSSLNKPNGMSRFLCREESPNDIIDASHAGTAISIASGMAFSNKINHSENCIFALVGDGALVEGMSMEGLNFCTAKSIPLVIVINDNGMAIAPNVGGIHNLFSQKDWIAKSKNFFTGLGYHYFAIENGHDIEQLIPTLKLARQKSKTGATIVHVKTEKGYGLPLAKNHKYHLHFSMPFDPVSGEGISPTPSGKTYALVAGEALHSILSKNQKIKILTPATPYASALDKCIEDFPDRIIDVGMAEQHALGMATGLALQGDLPFVCYQATFMQRAYDQIIHDVAFMNLPVTILAVRSGFAGYDSHTHHGIYDLSYLRSIPNLQIFYPSSSRDLRLIIEERSQNPKGPMVILYPYEEISKYDSKIIQNDSPLSQPQCILKGSDAYIICLGNCIDYAIEASKELSKKSNKNIGIIIARWVKPFPWGKISSMIHNCPNIISIEENVEQGGLGSLIAEKISDDYSNKNLLRISIQDSFVTPGDKKDLAALTGINGDTIVKKAQERWGW